MSSKQTEIQTTADNNTEIVGSMLSDTPRHDIDDGEHDQQGGRMEERQTSSEKI